MFQSCTFQKNKTKKTRSNRFTLINTENSRMPRLGFNPDQQCRHCHKTLLWQKLKAVLCIQIRIHTLSLLTWYQLSHIKNRSHTVSPLMKKQNASRAIAARLRSLRSTGCYVKITKLLFEYKSTDGVKHDVLTHYTHFARSQALVKYSQQG